MEGYKVRKVIYDSDGYYDVFFEFINERLSINSRIYIYEDLLVEYKNNLSKLYDMKIKKFELRCESIGFSDELTLNYSVDNFGHVYINCKIINKEENINASFLIISELQYLMDINNAIIIGEKIAEEPYIDLFEDFSDLTFCEIDYLINKETSKGIKE